MGGAKILSHFMHRSKDGPQFTIALCSSCHQVAKECGASKGLTCSYPGLAANLAWPASSRRTMRDDTIPEHLSAFIAKHIDSVSHLEALLLLRQNPSEHWSTSLVAKRLYIPEQEAISVLARLSHDGFLTHSDGFYRYDCRPGELGATVDNLADTYSRQLIAVTNLIHSKTRRIREFAQAFKLKKDS